MRLGGQHHVPAALPLGKKPITRCRGGWVGPRVGLDGCRNSRPLQDSILRPSSQNKKEYRVNFGIIFDV
jgi:hypothetical protein